MSRPAKSIELERRLAISRKPVLIAMTSTTIGLFVAGTAFTTHNRHSIRQSLLRDLFSWPSCSPIEATPRSCSTAPNSRGRTLPPSTLPRPSRAARFYREDDPIVASHTASGVAQVDFPAPEWERLNRFETNQLVVFEPAVSGEEQGKLFNPF